MRRRRGGSLRRLEAGPIGSFDVPEFGLAGADTVHQVGCNRENNTTPVSQTQLGVQRYKSTKVDENQEKNLITHHLSRTKSDIQTPELKDLYNSHPFT